MKKKVFIVSSTPRKNGNSDILADEFARGACDAGHTVTKVNIRDLSLKFCIGCMSCHRSGKCVLNDEMNGLYEKVRSADTLVFATPVYYYAVCGQLKTFLDRLNPLYGRDNAFKEVYLLATAADGAQSAMDGAVKDIQGWIDCFDGVKLKGVLRGVGLTDAGEAESSAYAATAYETGRNI